MSSLLEAAAATSRPRVSSLRSVFAICGVTLGWVSADVIYGAMVEESRLRVLTVCLLPGFGAALVVALWRFGRLGPGPVPKAALAAGCAFLCLSAAIDLYVTVRTDPELTLEANPYIRALLDRTVLPTWSVFTVVLMTQALFVGAFNTSWWAFLRHRPTIVGAILESAPQTWPAFVKAATGGGRLSYRQWLLPLRPGEIPDPYHSVWPAALAVCFGTSVFRLWAAGEWLELVPPGPVQRAVVLLIGVCGTLFAYFAWLARSWRRRRAAA